MSSPNDRSPMARGMEMVARVMAAAMMMVLPGLGGQWLDRRFGTGWLSLLGFGLGISISIYYLLTVTRPKSEISEKASRNGGNPRV